MAVNYFVENNTYKKAILTNRAVHLL